MTNVRIDMARDKYSIILFPSAWSFSTLFEKRKKKNTKIRIFSILLMTFQTRKANKIYLKFLDSIDKPETD
jgi:hypothetical protein